MQISLNKSWYENVIKYYGCIQTLLQHLDTKIVLGKVMTLEMIHLVFLILSRKSSFIECRPKLVPRVHLRIIQASKLI